MSEVNYMKKPCQHCPFRNDVTPFLHPDRAYQIAAHASNPYNSFPCHKTTEPDERDCGQMIETSDSKQCAGFLTMRARETSVGIPEGFEPAWDLIYEDAYDMYEAYKEEWNN